MLREIGDVKRIKEYVARAKDKNDPFRLMGFGHRVYKNYDPRAKVMQQTAEAVLKELNLSDPVLDVARELHLGRIFVLTFETEFFSRHGFAEIEGTPVTAEVYEEMCRSYDTGVAEFLDLSYVKPNILGNTRMIRVL